MFDLVAEKPKDNYIRYECKDADWNSCNKNCSKLLGKSVGFLGYTSKAGRRYAFFWYHIINISYYSFQPVKIKHNLQLLLRYLDFVIAIGKLQMITCQARMFLLLDSTPTIFGNWRELSEWDKDLTSNWLVGIDV